MKTASSAHCCAIVTSWTVLFVACATTFGADNVVNGKKLFVHHWQPNDPLSPKGDGLGPMRNESSCVACHFQGGVGGGGTVDKNVDLLSAKPPRVARSKRADVRALLPKIHPGFRAQGAQVSTTLVLHKFGQDETYTDWRLRQQGINVPVGIDKPRRERMLRVARRKRQGKPVFELPKNQGVSLMLSQRNTPALFGAGLIDKIPASALEAVATLQAKRHPNIAGRVPPANGGAGRFGWRGQTATLRDFVLAACANELGLQNGEHHQAKNPQRPKYLSPGDDLTSQQCDDLRAFVASLPRPKQIKPRRQDQAQLIDYGENLFNTIGCAVCHIRKLDDIDGLYSDLLLHNMGPLLKDPAPAQPTTQFAGTQFFGGGYFGGSVDLFVNLPTAVHQEWRTPPLWGVASSAPYMHDGRAATLLQAILLHRGQAQFAMQQFATLPAEDRAMLIAFLNSLVAPSPFR